MLTYSIKRLHKRTILELQKKICLEFCFLVKKCRTLQRFLSASHFVQFIKLSRRNLVLFRRDLKTNVGKVGIREISKGFKMLIELKISICEFSK